MGGLQQGHVTGLRRLRGKALLHCERELWGPLEMACSGDLMPSTNPCLPTSSHVAHPQPPMSRPEPPMLPAWTSHGGTPDADACKGAKGLGAGGWRSACGMLILPDSSLPPSGEHRTWPWPWPWPTPDTTTLRIRVTSDSSTSTQHECSAQRPRPWGLLCAPHLCSPPVQPPVRPCAPTAASCLPYRALPHVTPPVLFRQS